MASIGSRVVIHNSCFASVINTKVIAAYSAQYNMIKRILNKVSSGLALIGLAYFFLRNALSSNKSFALFDDNEFFVGPIFASMSSSYAQGEWPLRMSELLGGLPLYNFTQFTSLYPFYFWFLPLYEDPVESMQTMHWLTLLHILIYQIMGYFFLKSLNLSRFSAVVGATLIAFSANSLDYTAWISVTAPYSWMPLYLMGMFGVLQKRQKRLYFCLGLVGIFLLTTASPAQPLIHVLLFTVISCSVFFFVKIYEKQSLSVLLSGYSYVTIIGVVAILLTAPVLVPAVLGYEGMIRWLGPFGSVVGNQSLPFEAFLFDQLAVKELLGVVFPISGVVVGNQFIGIITIILATLAVFSVKKNWVVSVFIIIAIYSLLSSTGNNLGFAYVNYELPFINKIREPSRW